jgi:hypothetical protein
LPSAANPVCQATTSVALLHSDRPSRVLRRLAALRRDRKMMVVREVLLPLSFTKLRSALLLMLAGILFTSLSRAVLPADSNSDGVKRGFKNPPDDCRIMMRWWWFGPAVTKPELKREIEVMKAAGIGGFEIQPVYPMGNSIFLIFHQAFSTICILPARPPNNWE